MLSLLITEKSTLGYALRNDVLFLFAMDHS
jgi:hypothetical protein